MQVKIIGGSGGVTKDSNATSYLIDDVLLIDAGSAAEGLDIDEQVRIENILISHAHLDHTKDLAFICDNCFGLKERPFQVYSHKTTIQAIKDHLFNDIIWPDFSVLPSKDNPTMVFNELKERSIVELGDYRVEAVRVNHPGDAMGFVVEKGDCALLFTQDTQATEEIWEVGKGYANLKGIFTEVSFPERLKQVAMISDHHTPQTLGAELKKMPPNIPVYLGHLKPNFRQELLSEIAELGEARLHVMDRDNLVYQF